MSDCTAMPALRLTSTLRSPAGRWRLRTGLLLPVLILVPLVLAATALSWESVTRREAETLVAQRQATALAGLNARLKERQQANETISYLLSRRDSIAQALDAGNTLRVAQTLVLLQATLDVSYINVYAANGQRLLQALVPVTDLEEASQERTRVVAGGTLALLLTLVGVAVCLARAIARPLD